MYCHHYSRVEGWDSNMIFDDKFTLQRLQGWFRMQICTRYTQLASLTPTHFKKFQGTRNFINGFGTSRTFLRQYKERKRPPE